MGTLGAIVGMSFLCAIGILLVVLGCALDEFKTDKGSWWIMFNLFFYVLAPVPALIVRRVGSDYSSFSGASNLVAEISLFFTAGVVVSAFGLPIVLARGGIKDQPCASGSLVLKEQFDLFKNANELNKNSFEPTDSNVEEANIVNNSIDFDEDDVKKLPHMPKKIKYGAMGLVMTGNFFIFLTILLFFTVFQAEDEFGF